jgi:UDP-hydrolysing UDP-N-acetyl-D-glucosamine 2-epimerase
MSDHARTIAVVTGTRAEFGLLRSVMRAIRNHSSLELQVIATGIHLLPPAMTVDEVAGEFEIAARIPMQKPHECTRNAEASALGHGISGLAGIFAKQRPDIVLVLGDRIEAFAAAAAAAVSGIRVAHMHGGDRAEGLVDESLRHAISKLAHLHLPATETSANRLIAMGEDPQRVHVVGSPAMDEVAVAPPLSDHEYEELGSPQIIFLLHPVGDEASIEQERAVHLLEILQRAGRTLALHANHDPGRDGILGAIAESRSPHCAHLPREKFLGLLRRAKVLVGNSSAGLIEAAAIPIWCVNVGRRQSGRERAGNVMDVENWDYQTIETSLHRPLSESIGRIEHPYGDGHTGQRVAHLLATLPLESLPIRKRNTY